LSLSLCAPQVNTNLSRRGDNYHDTGGLWRTLKYERIYLNVYETGAELSKDMTYWFNWYNVTRKHSSLDKLTPDEAYYQGLEKLKLAA